ncbi:MAG: nitroreductase family protein [Rhodospirillaceae bacterium]|nr:MAG: nitroreductase family protein [Rhodospirillaceae bacterium]
MKLNLSVDEVLTTTRAVRKRLDVSKPVPRAVIEECLELALQAPNGSNRNVWRWVVVDDRAMIAKVADQYKGALGDFSKVRASESTGIPREDKLMESALSLVGTLDKVPAMLIPLMSGRADGKSVPEQAAMWGSITQAVWSFFLALRERGLGSVWTTVTLQREKEIAGLLGIPFDQYTQVGLFPIAYTLGTDFKKAWRKPVSEVLSYNKF